MTLPTLNVLLLLLALGFTIGNAFGKAPLWPAVLCVLLLLWGRG